VAHLARLAQVSEPTARRFLRAQPEAYTRHDDFSARLQSASEQLQREGQPLSERALARLAGVSRKSAHRFLHPPQPREQPREARLQAAFARLQMEDQPLTASALARLAQVRWQTAVRFLAREISKQEYAA